MVERKVDGQRRLVLPIDVVDSLDAMCVGSPELKGSYYATQTSKRLYITSAPLFKTIADFLLQHSTIDTQRRVFHRSSLVKLDADRRITLPHWSYQPGTEVEVEKKLYFTLVTPK